MSTTPITAPTATPSTAEAHIARVLRHDLRWQADLFETPRPEIAPRSRAGLRA